MLWVLAAHIFALLFWCASLLYLVLMAIRTQNEISGPDLSRGSFASIERFVFTHIASPIALAAIISGTVLFLLNRTVDGWLIAKLSLVSALVVCHALTGWLVLRVETATADAAARQILRVWGKVLGLMLLVLIVAIVWLVLAKPAVEVW